MLYSIHHIFKYNSLTLVNSFDLRVKNKVKLGSQWQAYALQTQCTFNVERQREENTERETAVGMILQYLTFKVILWQNSSAPLYSFLCFYRCLLPVVLGRRESITLSDWRKGVDSPRHHLAGVRSTDMRQGSHI